MTGPHRGRTQSQSRRAVLQSLTAIGGFAVFPSVTTSKPSGSIAAESAAFRITELELSPEDVGPEASITVSAQITNEGSTTETGTVELLVADHVVRDRELTLDSEQTADLSFETYGPADEGEYEYTLRIGEDAERRTLTVRSGPPGHYGDDDHTHSSTEDDSPTGENTADDSPTGENTDDSGAGFGVGGGLAAVVGAGYLLQRWQGRDR